MSSSGRRDDASDRSFDADDVVDVLRRELGIELVRHPRFDIGVLATTFVPLDPSGHAPYRAFHVAVSDDVATAVREGFVPAPGPDAPLVTWRYEPPDELNPAGDWAAVKMYGNVKLTWHADRRELDEDWHALDGALQRLTRGS